MANNRIYNFIIYNLGLLISVFWTFIGIINHYFKDYAITAYLNEPYVFWILTVLLIIGILCRCFIRKRIINLKLSNNSTISLCEGDITKKYSLQNCSFVFASSNFFNTRENIVNKELSYSYVKQCGLSSEDVQESIKASLGSTEYTSIENKDVTLDGNTRSYKMGTISSIKIREKKQTAFFLAVTNIKESGNSFTAKCNRQDITTALNNVWNSVTQRERSETICLPAIGSGLALAYTDPNISAYDICRSFVEYSQKHDLQICKNLIIVNNNKEFNINKIASALTMLFPNLKIE